MKRLLRVLGVGLLLCGLVVMPVLAGKPDKGKRGLKGQAGNSNVAFIELWEKDANWDIVDGGAWGKLKYNLAGPTFDFVFNGHGLNPDGDYTLIYYPDYAGNPWPRIGIRCLATGTANPDGNIHLAASVELNSDLPMAGDISAGAKIWLVEATAVDCSTNTMSGWNPTEYLFEYDVITYTDTS